MAYCRVETADGYTVMSNYHLRDMRLSLKARGLLSQILSLPESWDMTISGLSKINRECSDTIASIIKELEETGYITRYRERRKNGTYGEIFYDIRMKPRHFDDPKRKKSERVKPKQMSSAQLSKEKSNKEKENKELLNIHQSIQPDGIDKIDGYRAIILENIEYDLIVNQHNKYSQEDVRFQGLYNRRTLYHKSSVRLSLFQTEQVLRQYPKDVCGLAQAFAIFINIRRYMQAVPLCFLRTIFSRLKFRLKI